MPQSWRACVSGRAACWDNSDGGEGLLRYDDGGMAQLEPDRRRPCPRRSTTAAGGSRTGKGSSMPRSMNAKTGSCHGDIADRTLRRPYPTTSEGVCRGLAAVMIELRSLRVSLYCCAARWEATSVDLARMPSRMWMCKMLTEACLNPSRDT